MLHALFRSASLRLAPVLFLLVGCEGRDMQVHAELAELRTRTSELERENNRLAADLKETRNKVNAGDFLGQEALREKLDLLLPELRAALTRAFPGKVVDPVNTGTISTPTDMEGFPYTSEVIFGLSEGAGRQVTTYTINIKADRQGRWQLPELGAYIASGSTQTIGAAPGEAPPQTGGMGTTRVVEWGSDGSAAAPSSSTQTTTAPASRNQTGPLPAQDSRVIQFE